MMDEYLRQFYIDVFRHGLDGMSIKEYYLRERVPMVGPKSLRAGITISFKSEIFYYFIEKDI